MSASRLGSDVNVITKCCMQFRCKINGGLPVRDLTPHIGRIIYFHVIKVNINKA
jgi:hypothetical protein